VSVGANDPAATAGGTGDGSPDRPGTPWFPFAIALYLVLVEWSERTGATARAYGDLLGSAALALAMAGLGWAIAAPLTRDRDRRALTALLWVLWAGLFLSFQVTLYVYVSEDLGTPGWAAIIWSLLILLLTLLVTRGRRSLAAIVRVLNVASVVLLALGVTTLVAGRGENPDELPERDARMAFAERGPARPDIYVLLLDKYTSGPWLEASYGHDHRPFEDSLRALGFAVPRHSPAPYAHTLLSVTSFLEGRYVHPFDGGIGWEDLLQRVEGAGLWPRLQALGYRYAFFPSTFAASRNSSPADMILKAPASARATPGETWWVNSPFWVMAPTACRLLRCDQSLLTLTPYPIEHGEELEWKLRMLATLPDSTGPVVAFAHLLTPHEPYLFDDDCSLRRPWWPSSDQGDAMDARVRAAYALQVRCLDRLLLETITAIITRSEVPPVILLQGDHGHGRLTTDVMRGMTLDMAQATPAQVAERMSVFSAYRFPGAAEVVPDTASPVNALRLALRGVLPDTVPGSPLQPSRAYWSTYQSPFRFTEVPLDRLRPDPPAGR
jgi:hypothetical protein